MAEQEEPTAKYVSLLRKLRKKQRVTNINSGIFEETLQLERRDYWSIKGIDVCPRSRPMKMFPLIEKVRECLEHPTPCDHPDKYRQCKLYLAWHESRKK